MEKSTAGRFLAHTEEKSFDLKHRRTINFNIGRYEKAVAAGRPDWSNHELARSRAAWIKSRALNRLDEYLLEFESNFQAHGGKVIWAQEAAQALDEIVRIMKARNARLVVKSKSMTTEELHLNECLNGHGVESFETDLGEYIVQLAGQKPYHIVTPAMHMSQEDIADLFANKLKTAPGADAETLVAAARQIMREKYTQADVGISGANFLLADAGAIAITENEGNARLSVTFPKVHIAIAGIEKILPSYRDLDLFWPLLAHSGTGQQVTVYNSIIGGPKRAEEEDGPREMYVILLDNGRTKLLADAEKRQALNCIRCGACLNACPVYKNIGGHSYETTYSGPIGSVITPHMASLPEFRHLSFASSLCGGCTSVCPVKIDIHNLLLLNRRQSVREGHTTMAEREAYRIWSYAVRRRWILNLPMGRVKSLAFKVAFGKTWGRRRATLNLSGKTFGQLWADRQKNR